MSNTELDDSFWDQFEDIDEAQATEISPLFKMQGKGSRARIFFPLVKPSTKKIAMKRVEVFNYSDPSVENSWARFQAPENKESKAYETAVMHCGEPTVVRATPVLVYETNDSGKVISGEDYSIVILKITPQRLQALKSLQMEHDLSKIDIFVTLNDEKYQNMSFQVAVSSAIRDGELKQKDKNGNSKLMKIEIDRKAVVEEAIDLLKNCDTAVASKWSEQQILNFFNKKDGGGYDSDEDFEEEESPKPSRSSKDIPDDEDFEEEESPKPSRSSKRVSNQRNTDDFDDDWED